MGEKTTYECFKDDFGQMNNLDVTISMSSAGAEICSNALLLETHFGLQRRSKVSISASEDGLRLKVSAEDLHALRASVNTYLRWIMMCDNIVR